MNGKLGELVVPAIAMTGCVLFWWHIQEARSVAQRVPNLVMIFTIGMTLVVLGRRLVVPGWRSPVSAEGGGASGHDDTGQEDTGKEDTGQEDTGQGALLLKRAAFTGLCVGYFLLFSRIGFDLANLLFLLCAYRLAGLPWRMTALASAVSVISFRALALAMDFNVPSGPFGF